MNNKFSKYFSAINEMVLAKEAASHTWCYFCGKSNLVTFDLHSTMVNLKTECFYCKEEFAFDVTLHFITETFDPAILRSIPRKKKPAHTAKKS